MKFFLPRALVPHVICSVYCSFMLIFKQLLLEFLWETLSYNFYSCSLIRVNNLEEWSGEKKKVRAKRNGMSERT